MKEHKLTVLANCGEKTCTSEHGKACRYLRVVHFASEWACNIFDKELGTTQVGDRELIMRLPECIAAEQDENCGGCFNCLDDPAAGLDNPTFTIMIVCGECGNKRCPKATNHNNECTNSNKPNQPGSRFCY